VKAGLRAATRWLVVALAVAASVASGRAEETPPAPVKAARVFVTRPGQFEIITLDAEGAQEALGMGQAVWSALEGPLALPVAFPTPVTVRMVPVENWKEAEPVLVAVEPGGLVTAWVKWEPGGSEDLRRAMVRGLIMKRAVAWHGVAGKLTVPWWLEQASVAACEMVQQPAMTDAWQQDSAKITRVPALELLLSWERGQAASHERDCASVWLLAHLRAEAGARGRWEQWLRPVMGGADPVTTLQGVYGAAWKGGVTRELWWQTGFHHQRRARAVPMMTLEDTRAWLSELSRWVVREKGRETVLALEQLDAVRGVTWVKAALEDRANHLQGRLGVVHPFYMNAAISLGRYYEALAKGKTKAAETAREEFFQDAQDGRDLEDAVEAALGRMEK